MEAIALMSGQDGQTLQIELGESGGKVGAAVQTEWSTESNDLSLHVILVAGARTQH